MALNKQQKKYLSTLVCQRLREDPANKALAERFVNLQNSKIAGALNKEGWETDEKGKLAYYIVKDPELNVPMFFFSLRCGELHKPLDPVKLKQKVKNSLMLLKEAITVCHRIQILTSSQPMENFVLRKKCMNAINKAQDVEPNEWAKELIAKQLVDGELPDKAWEKLWIRVIKQLAEQQGLDADQKMDGENIVRTKENYAAVELVHFCTYDPINWALYGNTLSKEERKRIKLEQNCVARKWHDAGMDAQPIGYAIFWQFVVPAIEALTENAACEYVYLFAADDEGNRYGGLTTYYRQMGFDFQDKLNVTKPFYDFCCYFMCQKVASLRTGKNKFLRDYNKTTEPAGT
jgi:hypothetical protein